MSIPVASPHSPISFPTHQFFCWGGTLGTSSTESFEDARAQGFTPAVDLKSRGTGTLATRPWGDSQSGTWTPGHVYRPLVKGSPQYLPILAWQWVNLWDQLIECSSPRVHEAHCPLCFLIRLFPCPLELFVFEVVHKASEHGLLRTICHRVPRITPFDAVSVSLNFGSSVHSRFWGHCHWSWLSFSRLVGPGYIPQRSCVSSSEKWAELINAIPPRRRMVKVFAKGRWSWCTNKGTGEAHVTWLTMTDHPCKHLCLERKVATAAEEAGLPAGMAKIGCRSNRHAKEKTPEMPKEGLSDGVVFGTRCVLIVFLVASPFLQSQESLPAASTRESGKIESLFIFFPCRRRARLKGENMKQLGIPKFVQCRQLLQHSSHRWQRSVNSCDSNTCSSLLPRLKGTGVCALAVWQCQYLLYAFAKFVAFVCFFCDCRLSQLSQQADHMKAALWLAQLHWKSSACRRKNLILTTCDNESAFSVFHFSRALKILSGQIAEFAPGLGMGH